MKQTGFGSDLGVETYIFPTSGIPSWNDSRGNFFGLSYTLSGVNLPTPTKDLMNSSAIVYNWAGTISGTTYNVSTYYVQKQPYNMKLTIVGTLSRSVTIALKLANTNHKQVSYNATDNPNMICFGSFCFDWNDAVSSGISTTFSNSTDTLSFNVGTSFRIDPIATDGSATNRTATTTNEECTLTTTNANDIVIMYVGIGAATSTSMTVSGGSLTWTQRQSYTIGGLTSLAQWYFYAKAATALSAVKIKASWTTSNNAACIAFGISSADQNTIFDTNTNNPTHNSSSATVTPQEVSNISTTARNSMILGFCTCAGSHTQVAVAPFTILAQINGGPTVSVETEIVSTVQTNLKSAQTSSGGSKFIYLGDVVLQAAPTVSQTKNCVVTAATSGTCTFASNVPVNDWSVVGVADSISSTGVSSVTDNAGTPNTYVRIIDQSTQALAGDTTLYGAKVTSAGTLTVTVNFGGTINGRIILYDINGATSSTPESSSGTGLSSTAPSVTSYSPDTPSLAVGILNSACITTCTVSAGTGYTLDNNAGIGATLQASSESKTNVGTVETTPFSLSSAAAFNEVSASFVPSGDSDFVVEPISQSLTITPSLARSEVLSRAISATLTTAATIARVVSFPRTISQTLTTTATIIKSGALSRAISQTLLTTAAVARRIVLFRTISQSLTAIAVIMQGTGRFINVSLTTSALTSRQVSLIRQTAVTLLTTSLVSGAHGFFVAISVTLTTSTGLFRRIFLVRDISDSLSIFDSVMRTLGGGTTTVTTSITTTISGLTSTLYGAVQGYPGILTAILILLALGAGIFIIRRKTTNNSKIETGEQDS